MIQPIQWGILGAGTIAKAFADGAASADAASVVAVGSRSVDKARAFAQEKRLGDVACHGSYEDLLADPQVQAIYIALPHPMHATWSIRAAQAGKHVFCEKPATMNHPEAMAVLEAVRAAGVFYMEAFKDRCHPQTDQILEAVRDGAIGQVRMIQADFGFNAGDAIDPQGRLFNLDLGGGGILDVGCYPVQWVRRVAGAAVGRDFDDPDQISGQGRLGETGVDEWAVADLKFPSGIVATLRTAVRAALPNAALITGSEGSIHVPDPWLNDRATATRGCFTVESRRGSKKHKVKARLTSFGYEVQTASQAILEGRVESPAMSWDDTLGQMKTLDGWRSAVGLTYPHERPEVFAQPLNGKPPAPAPDAPMVYGRIPGLDRDVSRLIMGCDNQQDFAHAAVVFDHWVQRGGNTFDTAHLYGGGKMERLLGQWHQSRGVRDQINLIAKGAHTPFCTPEWIRKQLELSLERLQTPHVEIYLMHRDNPEVPVGEFVDVLHEQVAAGRIGVFGGSNWSISRIAEANEYAQRHDRQGFTLTSNNFSLARMINPVWKGCVAASDPPIREYLIEHQMPNLAWSSQARGYFVSRDATGKAAQWDHDNAWDSPENRQRRERAFELADRYDVSAINIAAAYVLSQPFPSFALIGPRTLRELETSLPALRLQLTEQEMAYLDLRD